VGSTRQQSELTSVNRARHRSAFPRPREAYERIPENFAAGFDVSQISSKESFDACAKFGKKTEKIFGVAC